MHFSDFPFLRYLPFFVLGICGASLMPFVALPLLALGLVILWLGYFILLRGQGRKNRLFYPIMAYSMIWIAGALLALQQQERKQRLFLLAEKEVGAYEGIVQDYDLEKPNSWQNQVTVTRVYRAGSWDTEQTELLLYHRLGDTLRPGDRVLVKGMPEQIPETSGPEQFDYRGFLLRKGVAYRHFAGADIRVLSREEHKGLGTFVKQTRQNLALEIEHFFSQEAVQEIAKALLLGEKRSLDPDTRSAYGQAGVMHILAVSGLHVGIVYALFLFLANTLKLKGKPRKLYFLAMVLFLWFYAGLTGFFPSVIRASCMFSLLIFGQIQNRKPPTFNVLAFSAMLMLAINPEVISDVGFQLSYLAVGGIVLLQPLILRFWLPSNLALEYIWNLLAVSMAAQLATFPLSVFYFHYFPTYFLLGNLFVLPLAFVIMQVGVPWLMLMHVPFLGEALAWVLSRLISFQNWIIIQLSALPGGKLDRLTLDVPIMLLIWLFLLIWVGWELGSKRVLIRVGVYGTLVLLIAQWYLIQGRPIQEVLIYSEQKGFLLDYYTNERVRSFNTGFRTEQASFVADPYRLARGMELMPEEMTALTNIHGDVFFPELDIRLVRDSTSFRLRTVAMEQVFLLGKSRMGRE